MRITVEFEMFLTWTLFLVSLARDRSQCECFADSLGTLLRIIYRDIIPLASSEEYLEEISTEDFRAMRPLMTECAMLSSAGLTRVSPYSIQISCTLLISRLNVRQYFSRSRNGFCIGVWNGAFSAKTTSISRTSVSQQLQTWMGSRGS